MIYFLAPGEGLKFIKINRASRKPKSIINNLNKSKTDFVLIFKCGIVYDSILKKLGYNPYRNIRKWGKLRYKKLLKIKLSEETVSC